MIMVSIVVPIYGVECYIEKCVRSLFEQTFKNIEYIFDDYLIIRYYFGYIRLNAL